MHPDDPNDTHARWRRPAPARPPALPATLSCGRSRLDVLEQQLAAISALARALRQSSVPDLPVPLHVVQDALEAGRGPSLHELFQREHDAMIRQVHAQLISSADGPAAGGATPTAVLAHRSAWVSARVGHALTERGVTVLTHVPTNEEAVGISVAEQPDVVLLEDDPMPDTGEQLVHHLRRFCPDTLIVAQVQAGRRVGALLDAGAAAVFTRRVPPTDLAAGMFRLMAVHKGTDHNP